MGFVTSLKHATSNLQSHGVVKDFSFGHQRYVFTRLIPCVVGLCFLPTHGTTTLTALFWRTLQPRPTINIQILSQTPNTQALIIRILVLTRMHFLTIKFLTISLPLNNAPRSPPYTCIQIRRYKKRYSVRKILPFSTTQLCATLEKVQKKRFIERQLTRRNNRKTSMCPMQVVTSYQPTHFRKQSFEQALLIVQNFSMTHRRVTMCQSRQSQVQENLLVAAPTTNY